MHTVCYAVILTDHCAWLMSAMRAPSMHSLKLPLSLTSNVCIFNKSFDRSIPFDNTLQMSEPLQTNERFKLPAGHTNNN